jgi:hypothetical protein
MDMAQMMERLLAVINANHEKMEAYRKTDKEQMLAEMKANQARMDGNTKTMQENLARADAYQARMEALTEMTARMDANMWPCKLR